MTRKVIQLSSLSNNILIALCDDGTMWERWKQDWIQIDDIPQDEF